jgi:hypothetical protein
LLVSIQRRLGILIGDVGGDADAGAGEAPALERAHAGDLEVADQGGAVLVLDQRADVGGEDFGEHRHDAVGEIDAVAALPRFLIERRAGADVEADVGDGDDRLPAAGIDRIVVGRGPDRVVMVAGVGGVDGDDGDVGEVFTVAELLLGDALRFLQHMVGKLVGDAVLVDRDQAEAARREGIAEDFGDAGGEARRATGFLGEDEIAGLGLAHVGDGQFAAFLLLHRAQPEGLAFLVDDAEQQFAALGELLHRVGGPAVAALLGAGQDAITHAERARRRAPCAP